MQQRVQSNPAIDDPQASYLQAMHGKAIAKAKQLALQNPSPLCFDPQGRVIIEVALDESDKKSRQDLGLGTEPTSTLTVSLDVKDVPGLQEKFLGVLSQKIRESNPEFDQENLIGVTKLYDEAGAGSITPLQQEMHFHCQLAARVYGELSGKKEEAEAAQQATMKAVNDKVMSSYAKALVAATKNGKTDIAKLNQQLDKERKTIAKLLHVELAKNLKLSGIDLRDIDKTKIKHTASVITATSNDILHTDSRLGLMTWIAGTEVTSHDRQAGKVASRQIVTRQYSSDGVVANDNPRTQIRVPSLDVKDKTHEIEIIDDVSNKLSQMARQYGFKSSFTYNLLTAINDRLGDVKGNKQTQGARLILSGAHRYNKQQLSRPEKDRALCYVQNISVNGFGAELGYTRITLGLKGRKTQNEATLMAEMALLNTIKDTLSPKQQKELEDINKQYEDFLKKFTPDPKKPSPFYDSAEGKKAVKLINDLKQAIKKETNTSDRTAQKEPDLRETAKRALKNMMAHNLHFSHDHAKLIQALSIYAEPESIAGCKSANERLQAINGRVAVLDRVATATADFACENIKRLLINLADEKESVGSNAKKLNSAINGYYNDNCLHAAPALVSPADQGAAAKVEKKSLWTKFLTIFGFANRNQAETGQLTNMSAGNAGTMQAHKGVEKLMSHAIDSTLTHAEMSGTSILQGLGVSPAEAASKLEQGFPPPPAPVSRQLPEPPAPESPAPESPAPKEAVTDSPDGGTTLHW